MGGARRADEVGGSVAGSGRGRAGGGAGGRAAGGAAAEKIDYLDTVVLPAVFESLPSVFPEFGFKRRGSGWVGADVPSDQCPLGVRGGRVYVGRLRNGALPMGFSVAGGDPVPFLGYLSGNFYGHPKGEEFWRRAAELAARAGVEAGPLDGSGAPDPAALKRAQEALERQRRHNEAVERRKRKRKIARARELWDSAREDGTGGVNADGHPLPHPAVLDYLSGRGIDVGTLPARSLGRLRFCARTPVGDRKKVAPAVLAAITRYIRRPDGSDGEGIVAVHRLYLAGDGRSIDPAFGKMMLGPVGGGCLRLGMPGGDLDTLILCEGIETGVALRAATGWPVWACLSTSGLLGIDVPPSLVEDGQIKRIVIAGDFDDPFKKDQAGSTPKRGQGAAREAAERLANLFDGLHVAVALPETWAPKAWREEAA